MTIIPRGRALGLTQQLPVEDRLNLSKEFALNEIAILMGGRIAEELVFGQQTTGAGNDIEVATDLARKMVCEWGMSEKMGPLTFGRKEENPFLGRDITSHSDYSENTAQEIDQEVKRIVMEQYARAKRLLEDNRAMLERLAEALLEYESLDTDDIDRILSGQKIVRAPERRMTQTPDVPQQPAWTPPVDLTPTVGKARIQDE